MTGRKLHINRLFGFGASIGVILLVASLFASFGFLEKQHLNGVEFTILGRSSGESLMDSADVRYPLAKIYPNSIDEIALDSISLETIEKQYTSNPFIRDCRTYIDKHNTLRIEIVERIPLIRIFSQNGGNYYIDREGVSMPVSDHFTPRTLLATGDIPILPLENHVDSSQIHEKLFELAHAIESDAFMTGFVSEIHVNREGNILLYPLLGDFTVRFDKLDGLEQKIENLKIFLREGLSRVGWDRYSEIIINYNNQVIGKKIVNP